jgi:hypothetical protein
VNVTEYVYPLLHIYHSFTRSHASEEENRTSNRNKMCKCEWRALISYDFMLRQPYLSKIRLLIPNFKQVMLLSTWPSDCRGGTRLKTMFVSVCGNLQHI